MGYALRKVGEKDSREFDSYDDAYRHGFFRALHNPLLVYEITDDTGKVISTIKNEVTVALPDA